LHILFAGQLTASPKTLHSLQTAMHLDDAQMQWIVGDLVQYALVRRHPDANFLCIDVERILRIKKLLPGSAFVQTLTLISLTTGEKPTARLQQPVVEEAKPRYPSFRLSRSGWQGGKSQHRHR
jgi:hypothetical protein